MTDHFATRFLCTVLFRLSKYGLRRIALVGLLGIGVLVWTILSLLLDPLSATLFLLIMGCFVTASRVGGQKLQISQMSRRARLLTDRLRSSQGEGTFTSWTQWPVEAGTREDVEAARKSAEGGEVVIGRIDNDGRVLGPFGKLPGLKTIDEINFVERYRYPIDIVLVGDHVLVRKDFRGDQEGFLREWYNLLLLHGKVNVPAVYRADERHGHLYKGFIPGRTVRDVFVNAGAKILSVQADNDPELTGLAPHSRIEAIWARGKTLTPSCLSERFLCQLENQVERIHQCGVAGLSLTYGNIMMDARSGAPWLLDFDGARSYRSASSLAFLLRRHQDRVNLNEIYGRRLPTMSHGQAPLPASSRRL